MTEFAYEPQKGEKKLPIDDAEHAAVQAVTTGLEGNKADIPDADLAGVKGRIAAAINKFYSGAEAEYCLSHSGKKPDEKPVHEIRLSTPSFAFKGPVPDVPIAPGVDYDALIAMTCPDCGGKGCVNCDGTGSVPDPKPLFVVRPLGKLNAVSDNNLKYDQPLLDNIREQVITKKPAGRQGHVSEANSSWEFPDDVAIWVGAAQHGDTLFGKAFVYRNTPFHEMVIRRKAAGSTLSNSIWGKGQFGGNADGTKNLRGLNLEVIDFAPMERAALEALGGQFETTSEMREEPMADKPVTEMTAEERHSIAADHIKTMAPSAVYEMMPDATRQHCAEMRCREMEPSAVNEMLPMGHRQHISECYVKEFGGQTMPAATPAAEMTDNSKQVAEMAKQVAEMASLIAEQKKEREQDRAVIAEFKQREFDSAMNAAAARPFATWEVRRPENQPVMASAQNNFKMYIVAEMAAMDGGQKLENIEAAASAAWPKYEPQAAMLKVALSGGAARVGVSETSQPGASYGYDPKTGRYTDEAAQRARGFVAPH